MSNKFREEWPGVSQTQSGSPLVSGEPDISLTRLLRDLLASWYIIIAGVFFIVLLVSGYMWLVKPKYTAEIRVFPNSEIQEQLQFGAGGLTASLNPFRSSGVEEATVLERYIAAITSIGVAEKLMTMPEIVHTVFASQWDAAGQQWHPPGGLVASLKSVLRRAYGLPGWESPDARDLSGYIDRNVLVTAFTVKGSTKNIGYMLSYSSKDPVFAKRFLSQLHNEANLLVLQQERSRALERAAYLQERLEQARTKQVVETLSELLIENERKLMMMSIDDNFAAMPLEPVQVSKQPTSPKPLNLLFLAVVLGSVIGVGIVVIRNVLSAGS